MVCPLRRAFFLGIYMYAVSYSSRIYSFIFLCLCAAVLLAPSVNAAVYPDWDDLRYDLDTLKRDVDRSVREMTKRPTNTTLTPSNSAPAITKNATGGLSATTNNILKTMGQPSTFSSTSNYSLSSAKNALKSCVRSPSCAGRTLGGGAIIYEGINAWKDVYDLLQDPVTNDITMPNPDGVVPDAPDYPNPGVTHNSESRLISIDSPCPTDIGGYTVMFCEPYDDKNQRAIVCGVGWGGSLKLVGIDRSTYRCQYAGGSPWEPEVPRVPASPEQLDDLIDEGYEPAVSDAPIVITGGGSPGTIELSTPAPAQLPSETRTETSSAGTTTTVIDRTINYTVTNNNTASPSISSSVTETSTTYDSNSNVVNTSTSTTSNPAVAPDPVAADPVVDFELPSFCSWASIVCDWIGWTQEPLGEDEPDLSQLITVFEPDEDDFDLGIGSGSCPAPMMLNLGIIGKTVEVKYDPFCSFLEMIKPFVLAAAYLFAAYLYVGVLRRG